MSLSMIASDTLVKTCQKIVKIMSITGSQINKLNTFA